MIFALNRILHNHTELVEEVGLLLVVGEETGLIDLLILQEICLTDHVGMLEANKLSNLLPDYFVVGEPTELKFGHAQKGVLKVNFILCCLMPGLSCVSIQKGRPPIPGMKHSNRLLIPDHSSYPERGDSAIHKLLDVLAEIRAEALPKNDFLGSTTLNVGLIEGGQALNALAARASGISSLSTCISFKF